MVEALHCGLIGQGCWELISTHSRHQQQHATPNLYLPLSVPCVVFSLSMLLYLSNHCVISNTFLQMAEKTTLLNLTFELRQRIWKEVIGHHKYLHIRLLHFLDVRSSQRPPEIHRDKALPNTGCSIPVHVGNLKQSVPICLYRHKDGFRNGVLQLSLKFLPICRQGHGEAERLVHTTTTFSSTVQCCSGISEQPSRRLRMGSSQGPSHVKSDVFSDEDFHGHRIVLSAMAMLYELKSLHVCVDKLDRVDTYLATVCAKCSR